MPRLQTVPSVAFTIFEVPRLDPITVVLQDIGPGAGRLIVECYGTAWSAYWGGMGNRTVDEFVLDCHTDYIASKLAPKAYTPDDADLDYLRRVVAAVLDALKERRE